MAGKLMTKDEMIAHLPFNLCNTIQALFTKTEKMYKVELNQFEIIEAGNNLTVVAYDKKGMSYTITEQVYKKPQWKIDEDKWTRKTY